MPDIYTAKTVNELKIENLLFILMNYCISISVSNTDRKTANGLFPLS
jgi:hypothetical protein